MTISRKHRRTIRVDDDQFIWWVQADVDAGYAPSNGFAVHVIRTDRRLKLKFPLGQPDETRHVMVMDGMFRGADVCGTYGRFLCPAFCLEPSVTPRAVAALIRWSTSTSDHVTQCDYLGRPI